MLVVVAISNLCFVYLIIIDYEMDSETRAYNFLVVVIGACTKRIELVSSFITLPRDHHLDDQPCNGRRPPDHVGLHLQCRISLMLIMWESSLLTCGYGRNIFKNLNKQTVIVSVVLSSIGDNKLSIALNIWCEIKCMELKDEVVQNGNFRGVVYLTLTTPASTPTQP
uniref:Uncharacterized protein n=1 Tax=Cucumis melo TaxID=3656 RepID=A0A9I9DE91_CUCME